MERTPCFLQVSPEPLAQSQTLAHCPDFQISLTCFSAVSCCQTRLLLISSVHTLRTLTWTPTTSESAASEKKFFSFTCLSPWQWADTDVMCWTHTLEQEIICAWQPANMRRVVGNSSVPRIPAEALRLRLSSGWPSSSIWSLQSWSDSCVCTSACCCWIHVWENVIWLTPCCACAVCQTSGGSFIPLLDLS